MIEELYIKTIAQKFKHDKELCVNELKKNGIHALLTALEPVDNTISQ